MPNMQKQRPTNEGKKRNREGNRSENRGLFQGLGIIPDHQPISWVCLDHLASTLSWPSLFEIGKPDPSPFLPPSRPPPLPPQIQPPPPPPKELSETSSMQEKSSFPKHYRPIRRGPSLKTDDRCISKPAHALLHHSPSPCGPCNNTSSPPFSVRPLQQHIIPSLLPALASPKQLQFLSTHQPTSSTSIVRENASGIFYLHYT